MKLELIATATFGLEAVVKREIQELGYKIIKTEDGKVTYLGCLLYTSPSPRDRSLSRMPSSA